MFKKQAKHVNKRGFKILRDQEIEFFSFLYDFMVHKCLNQTS